MVLYHGTSSRKEILHNGFNLNFAKEGRFGKGLYFSRKKESALCFGKELIQIYVSDDDITKIDYDFIADKFGLSKNEEEGYSKFHVYADEINAKAIEITYQDNDSEIVIYDMRIIKSIL